MPTDPKHGSVGAIAETGSKVRAETAPETGGEAMPGAMAGDDEPEIQEDMFADAPSLGTLKVPKADGYGHETVKRAGPGRPKGSRNLASRQLQRLVSEKYGHPVLRLAEIASLPVDVLAKTLGCSKLEAAELHRKYNNDVARYVAQQLPQQVQIEQQSAGVLMIQLGDVAQAGQQPAEPGTYSLPMTLAGEGSKAKEKTVENQDVSETHDAQSETGSRTDGTSD